MTYSLDDGLREDDVDDKGGSGIVVILLQYAVEQHNLYWRTDVVMLVHEIRVSSQQPDAQVAAVRSVLKSHCIKQYSSFFGSTSHVSIRRPKWLLHGTLSVNKRET